MSGISVKKNYIYNLAYQILTLITPFLTTPYISRVLGADNIGIYSFVNANVSYFILLGVFGLSTYSQIEVARRKDNQNSLSQFCVESMITRFITMGIAILVYVIIYIIAGNTYKIYYLIFLFTLIANGIDFTWICHGLEDFKSITIRNTIVKIASVVSIFIFVRTSDDLAWYIIINVLSVLIGNMVIIPTAYKYVKFTICKPIEIWIHIKNALAYFLPTVASTVISTSDKLMIGWMTAGGIQNGLYEQATKVESIIFMVFASLNITMRPRMAYLYKNGKTEAARRYLQGSTSFVIFLALPITVGLIQISDIFVPIFFGSGYDGVVVLLRIMAFWILIKAVSNCLLEQSVLQKYGPGLFSKIIWIGAIVNICLNYILIPLYQANGAAIASLTTELVILIITLAKTLKELSITSIIRNLGKEILSVAVMFICTFIIKQLDFPDFLRVVLMVIIGAVSYFLMAFILKDSMLTELYSFLKRKFEH